MYIYVIIYDAKNRKQYFGIVEGAFTRLFKGINGNEEGRLADYKLSGQEYAGK